MNSSLVKHVPLSVTTVLGRPNWANTVRSFSIVALEVADDIMNTNKVTGILRNGDSEFQHLTQMF